MAKFETLAAALAALLLVATLWSYNPLVRVAEGHSKSLVTASLAVYGSLRAINAFLSTAQEVEVGASLVASGTAQPLKVLEPLDDTVERVAEVVLTLTMVSGVMILGFAPVAGVGYALILLGWAGNRIVPEISRATLRLGLLMGLVMPLSFILAGVLGDLVTQSVLTEHETILNDMKDQIDQEAPAAPIDSKGPETNSASNWLLGQLSGVLDATATVASAPSQAFDMLDEYRKVATALWDKKDELLASYIKIIAAYVLKGLVLPALLVGLSVALVRASRPASSS